MKAFNKIILSTEEYKMILNDYKYERYFNEFIFDRFAIVLRLDSGKAIIEVETDGKVKIRLISGHEFMDRYFIYEENEERLTVKDLDGKRLFYIKNDGNLIKNSLENIKGVDKNTDGDILRLSVYALAIRNTKQYIMNESYKRKVVVKNSMTVEGTGDYKDLKKKINNHKGQYVTCLLKDIVNYATVVGHKEIHCECWSVRGHFRHYKNGKIVWIKNYEKGTKRNTGLNTDNKTYVLNKEGA